MEEKKVNEPAYNTDLLTLNKQIVEEIGSDLQNHKEGGKYTDPFKRRDQFQGIIIN